MLTRLGGPQFALNPDLIEKAEATPDTVVTVVSGTKYVVAESLEELATRIRDYRADVIAHAQALTESVGAATGRPAAGSLRAVPKSPAEVTPLHPREK